MTETTWQTFNRLWDENPKAAMNYVRKKTLAGPAMINRKCTELGVPSPPCFQCGGTEFHKLHCRWHFSGPREG